MAYKKAVDVRGTPQLITAEEFIISSTSSGYLALITEDAQENTPTSTYICIKDMTARSGCTTTSILVNEAIDSTTATLYTGLKLGFNGEMKTIQSVTSGTAGNASFTLSEAFSTIPIAESNIYSPRKEQRDANPVAVNYFKVKNNIYGQPVPNLEFNSIDNGKSGLSEYKGMGTTETALLANQNQEIYNEVQNLYIQTQSERQLNVDTLTELNSTYSPSSLLEGRTAWCRLPQEMYVCRKKADNTAYEWRLLAFAPGTFQIVSTNPVNAGQMGLTNNATIIFNYDIAVGSVNNTNFQIRDSLSVNVPSNVVLGSDKRTVIINPNADLTVGNYTLFISKSVTDIYNDTLGTNDYTYSFSAVGNAAPVVSAISTPAYSPTGFTTSGTITDAESEAIIEVDIVWSTNTADNPDTLLSGTNKVILTGTNITSFTGSGYAISTTMSPATTYYYWVCAKDATGTGNWVQNNFAIPADPAPTAPVISAIANSSGDIIVTLITPSTDATPETPVYDILVDSSVVLSNQTAWSGGKSLGTIYSIDSSHTVVVNAKDSYSNVTASNSVNLTIPANTAPSLSTLTTVSSSPSGFTAKATYTDTESEVCTGIDIVWSQTSTDNPDTLFAGTNKVSLTVAGDITNFTGASGYNVVTTLATGDWYWWARAKDATGTGSWVQSSVFTVTTAVIFDFEDGTVQGFSGTTTLTNVTTPIISGTKCLSLAGNGYAIKTLSPTYSTSQNIKVSYRFRVSTISGGNNGYFKLANIADSGIIYVWIASGKFICDGVDLGFTITANTNYLVEYVINRASNNFQLFVDGVLKGTYSLSANLVLETIHLDGTPNGGTTYYDDIKIELI